MSRLTYDTVKILEAATEESPLFVQLPSGGRHIMLSMLERASWRSTWRYDGQKLTDEQWDIIDATVSEMVASVEDGEEVNELANAVLYLADNLAITHSGGNNGLGHSGNGCCYDFYNGQDDAVVSSGNGWTQEMIDQYRTVVPGTFTDTGTNFPAEFADRAEFEAQKCAAANQLYRDFRTTLGGLQVLDLVALAGSTYLLGTALFGAGGVFTGLLSGAVVATPVGMVAAIVFILSTMLLFNQIGLRLVAIAERLDRETFVCQVFESTTYEEAKQALIDMVQDAHDLAILEGAFTANELFEGKLLELVAVMIPNEMWETVLTGAAILVDILVELPEDYDCSLCGAGAETEQFTITDFGTIAGSSLPQAGWYQSHGTGTIRVESGETWVEPTNCCSARAAHEVNFLTAGTVDIRYDRFGSATNVNVSFYIEKWDGVAWVQEHETPQKVATGTTSEELLDYAVTPGTYRFSWRLHNSGNTVRMANPSCLFTPS